MSPICKMLFTILIPLEVLGLFVVARIGETPDHLFILGLAVFTEFAVLYAIDRELN